MKKLLPILLLTSLFLSACSIWSKDDLFEKKLECQKYEEQVKQKYANDDQYFFDSIFYSKKYDSCFYRISAKNIWKTKPNHIIFDYFSNENISTKDDICDNSNCYEQQKKFNEYLELKWE